MSEQKLETKKVVDLDDAVGITRQLLRDMQYGYSIDDLVVEAYSFMRAESFGAVEVKNDADINLYDAAPELYECVCDALTDLEMSEGMRAHFEKVLKKARGEE